MEAGETLLVLGAAGGVGLAAVEIGKSMGARVIAAASTPEKLAVAIEHGAGATVDDSTDQLTDRVMALTEGRGVDVDVCFDPVGGSLFDAALSSLGWGGRILLVGLSPACPRFRRTGSWSSIAPPWVRRCGTSAGTRRTSSAVRWRSCMLVQRGRAEAVHHPSLSIGRERRGDPPPHRTMVVR